jgi:beta-lactamase regulating signal transducer with metallopeptidase domain
MHPLATAEFLAWLPAAFRAFAHAAAPIAITALWQSAVIALGLGACLRLAPRISAAHRYAGWVTGFAVAVGLEFLPIGARALTHGAGAGMASLSGAPAGLRIEVDVRWTLAIGALWLALAAFRVADLAANSLRLRRLWKSATPLDGELAARASAGVLRRVQVCTTRALDRPSVIGFLSPRILIPEWLLDKLSPAELDQVILHECEHLRRRDDWTNLAQKLCLILFPLNPALKWMEQQLCREREMACDEGVVRKTRAPRAYAACLTSLAERRRERNLAQQAAAALSLGAFERRSELVRRVQSILWRKNVLGPLGARALLSVLGCGLLVGAAELARSPQVVEFVSAENAAQTMPRTARADDMAAAMASPNVAHATDLVARGAPAYRATNALAILPAAAQPRVRNSAMEHSFVAEAVPANGRKSHSSLASLEPRQRLIIAAARMARTPGSAAKQTALPQQWIVLTTWEQVVRPTAGSGPVADMTTGADTAAEAPTRPLQNATRQVTVTQLILRVYPAHAASARSDQAQRGAKPDANPQTILSRTILSRAMLRQSAILPLDNGWLVIQL